MVELHAEMLAHLPRLRRFALALTGGAADADDLVQSAIERALLRINSFEPGTRMDSWMFKIAQNLWIDHKRAEQRRGQTVELDDAYGLAGEDGRTITEQRAMVADIRTAISKLPEGQRLVVAHVLVDGQTYQEAADILEIPVGTLMSRLSRARKTLETQVLGEGLLQ